MSETIFYWPDNTWVPKCDFREQDYADMSDDIGTLEVPLTFEYEQIDAAVVAANTIGE